MLLACILSRLHLCHGGFLTVRYGLYLFFLVLLVSDRMGLDGFIPKEIGMLTTLTVLDLTFNDKLGGPFPKAVCDFASLDSLYLGHTQIHGQLPTCIGNLKKLRSLLVSDTRKGMGTLTTSVQQAGLFSTIVSWKVFL
jgi:hypothetical protein